MSEFTWPATSTWPGADVENPEEMSFRGFVINSDHPAHPYDVVSVEGLRGYETRRGDTPIPRGDGDTPGDHHLKAKRPVLTVNAVGDYHDVVPPLLTAFRPSRSAEYPLVWIEGGSEVRLYCRPVEVPVPRTAESQRVTEVTIGLKASDPRIYGRQRNIVLANFKTLGGAVNDPVNEPKNATLEGGTDKVATNGGESDAHPQITIDGPDSGSADRVEITNTTNGSKLVLTASIGVGQTLTFRTREFVTRRLDTLIVELDGANQYDAWDNRADFLYLSPGDNDIRLEIVSGTSTGVRCALSWRDTWDGIRRDD